MRVTIDSRRPHLDALRTRRLQLRRPAVGDLSDYGRMHADPRVMATLGGVRDRAESSELLRGSRAHWDEYGFGEWTLRTPGRGAFVGRGGLRWVTIAGERAVEVRYALVHEYWARGLATELARASVWVAFEWLGLSDLVCFTLPHNDASRRVMEKVGFVYACDTEWKELPHVLYRLDVDGWREDAPTEPPVYEG